LPEVGRKNMRRNFQLSKNKFTSFPPEKQHKKCAEILKAILTAKEKEPLLTLYEKCCSWLSLSPLENNLFEAIEERFHMHIALSGYGLFEHNFLSSLTTQDRQQAKSWLSISTFLDGLRSTHNAGSIIRTIEAFRLGPVHFSKEMFSPEHPQVQSRSMGAWKDVHLHQTADLSLLPRPWIALETVSTAPPWNEWIYPKQATLIVGNEERGVSSKILPSCDTVVRIPLCGHKNSLNVANAFAIVAAEISSQQRYG